MEANAVALLFKEHVHDLRRYAAALSQDNSGLAEDAVSHAFLRALEKPDVVDIRYLVRTVRGFIFETYGKRNREKAAWDRWNAEREKGEVCYLPVSVQGHRQGGPLATLSCAERERVARMLERGVSPVSIAKRLGLQNKLRSIFYARDQVKEVLDREGALRRMGVSREVA